MSGLTMVPILVSGILCSKGVKESKEAPILKNKSVQKRFSVIPKKDKLFEIEKKKRKSMFKFDFKKPSAKKNKYIRKNAKKKYN